MSSSTILIAAGVALILTGIALALFVGPMISRQAAAKGGKPTPRALWYGIGALDMLFGVGLIFWSRAA